MTARIKDLYKALDGEYKNHCQREDEERQRKNKEAWQWAKANDSALKQMMQDAGKMFFSAELKKNADPSRK